MKKTDLLFFMTMKNIEANDLILYLLILLFILLIAVTALIIVFLFSFRRRKEREEDLRRDIRESHESELKHIQDVKLSLNKEFIDFSERVNRDLDDLHERTSGRLSMMEKGIRENLNVSSRENREVYENIMERMVRLDEAQKEFSSLSTEISSLQNILQDKKSRGIFGEVELYHLLETVLGEEGILFRKQYKLSTGVLADAVLFTGERFGTLCIDAKFPLENYRRMIDQELFKGEREEARKKFIQDVRKHIGDIRDKYIIPNETADMAVLFIPAEAVYSEIQAHYETLVDYSYRSRVFLTSPTTMMAYLTAVKNIALGLKKDEKAAEIAVLLRELSKDFRLFKERTESLNKHYEELSSDFHDIDVTSKKIMKKFDTLNDGDLP